MFGRRLTWILASSLLIACSDDDSDAAPTTDSGSTGSTEGGATTTSMSTAGDASDGGTTAGPSTDGGTTSTDGGTADDTGGTTDGTEGGTTASATDDTSGGTTADGSSSGGAVDLPTDPVCPDCSAGERIGFHGMALFGDSNHFLAHIPLFMAPHNMQLVAHIELHDAGDTLLTDDFGAGEYSLAPTSAFSLDSLGLGVTTEFTADVHNGNFEHGAPVLYSDVTVSVVTVLVGRQLPDDDPIAADLQEHYLVGHNDEAYMLNFIRDQRAFQQILSVSGVEGATLTTDVAPRVVTMSATPLASDAGTVQSTVADIELSLTIADELWCLVGPNFFTDC